MKIKFFIALLFILGIYIVLNDVSAMPNPAAAYCEQMGYTYTIQKTANGDEGFCSPEKGKRFDEWAFFRGKVGQSYSYCSKKGYDTKTVTDSNGEYAACVTKDKSNKKDMINFMENNKDLVIKSDVQIQPKNQLIAKLGGSGAASGGILTQDYESSGGGGGGGGNLPSSFDWRNNTGVNWMTPIRDQGSGNTCWAFAAIGAVEGKVNIDLNYKVDANLSEQEVVSDCCVNCGNAVSGGWDERTLDYIKSNGIANEECFPYTQMNGACSLCAGVSKRKTNIASYMYPWDVNTTKQAISENGPASICFTFYSDLYSYTSGIYKHNSSLSSSVGHCMDIVGYNSTGNYWIMKNSWGTGWGMNGYMFMDNSELSSDGISFGYDGASIPVNTTYDADSNQYVCVNIKNYIWTNKTGGFSCYGDDSDEKGAYEPNKEVSCFDGADNDEDGLIDSADPDCPLVGHLESYNLTGNVSITQYQFFNFSIGVRCAGSGDCGNVLGLLDPIQNKGGIISTTLGAIPFYTTSLQPQNCLNMHSGDSCNLTWQVNATGSAGTYQFFGIFNSSLPIPSVNSSKVNVTITLTSRGKVCFVRFNKDFLGSEEQPFIDLLRNMGYQVDYNVPGCNYDQQDIIDKTANFTGYDFWVHGSLDGFSGGVSGLDNAKKYYVDQLGNKELILGLDVAELADFGYATENMGDSGYSDGVYNALVVTLGDVLSNPPYNVGGLIPLYSSSSYIMYATIGDLGVLDPNVVTYLDTENGGDNNYRIMGTYSPASSAGKMAFLGIYLDGGVDLTNSSAGPENGMDIMNRTLNWLTQPKPQDVISITLEGGDIAFGSVSPGVETAAGSHNLLVESSAGNVDVYQEATNFTTVSHSFPISSMRWAGTSGGTKISLSNNYTKILDSKPTGNYSMHYWLTVPFLAVPDLNYTSNIIITANSAGTGIPSGGVSQSASLSAGSNQQLASSQIVLPSQEAIPPAQNNTNNLGTVRLNPPQGGASVEVVRLN